GCCGSVTAAGGSLPVVHLPVLDAERRSDRYSGVLGYLRVEAAFPANNGQKGPRGGYRFRKGLDMSAPVRPTRPAPLERLEDANTIDEVLRNIDLVIDWSISAHSTIGYFAALYKRATIAIREAVDEGKFDDCERMQRFDVLFARRYFNALNAYFHPHEYDGLMLAWEVALVGREVRRPIMVQQLMMALNAHICFDLGMAAAAVAPDSLPNLQGDFNRVNAILAGQVPGMLDVIQELSPVFRWIRRVVPNKGEVWLIRRLL